MPLSAIALKPTADAQAAVMDQILICAAQYGIINGPTGKKADGIEAVKDPLAPGIANPHTETMLIRIRIAGAEGVSRYRGFLISISRPER